MPKHYCDYCDVFLTHDSTSVRKAHNSGRNHLANVRDYYASLGHDKAQSIIDQITSAYETGSGPPPGGFGFGPQHLVAQPPPGFGGPMPPPGFGGPRPPFPPGMAPPGMMAPPFPPNGPMGAPPFPPNGMGAPPFPPNGAMGAPPFPPNGAMGGPPFPPPNNAQGPGPSAPGNGPTMHPDRMRMMGNGR
ncbi:U1 small nuclear ribonucleoprotein C [Mycena indigotica]|uniref:U1 small nuclear ribonucleoprotein C n=1 Tax=Mycena indigotica TaxID=2126181 RepID=A0A8H6SMZ4_9AGAR|nr:U1 small nuclear ribonucleoprotein C [Mycena indigotica]KAF7301830.1 U1 small nuclear ribonucleoprotein C [Mycena indigotica]